MQFVCVCGATNELFALCRHLRVYVACTSTLLGAGKGGSSGDDAREDASLVHGPLCNGVQWFGSVSARVAALPHSDSIRTNQHEHNTNRKQTELLRTSPNEPNRTEPRNLSNRRTEMKHRTSLPVLVVHTTHHERTHCCFCFSYSM
jgi:hypothetical protein